jgi:hypothetical protein
MEIIDFGLFFIAYFIVSYRIYCVFESIFVPF